MPQTKGIAFRMAVYQARRLRLYLEMAQLARKIARLKTEYKTLSRTHPKRNPRQNNRLSRALSRYNQKLWMVTRQ